MKNKTLVASTLAILSFAIFVSIVLALQVIPTTVVQAQNENSGLSFDVHTQKDEYVQFEPIPLTLRVVNPSSAPIIWKAFLNIGPSVNLLVEDETGTRTKWEGSKLATVLVGSVPQTLQSGAEYETETILDANLVEKIFSKPGRYTVRIELKYDRLSPEIQQKMVLSNTVSINIAEPRGINRQAYAYYKERIKLPAKNLSDHQLLELKQDFVNQFPNSVYAKYVAIELAAVYQALGEDEKALRELCRVSKENFYYTKQVQKNLQKVDDKLHPPILIPNLPEDAPVPTRPHPCLWVNN